MNINCTLFIQIINFFITYKVLGTYLFIPTLRAIKSRKDKENKLNAEIAYEESHIEQKNLSIIKHLFDFQTHVKKDYPLPKETVSMPSFEIGYKRDEKEIKNLSSKVENLLIEKVPHVR